MNRITALLIIVLCSPAVFAGIRPAEPVIDCMQCHDDYVFQQQFPDSVHGRNGCNSCHEIGNDLDAHMEGRIPPELISCGNCHQGIAEEYNASYHYLHQDFKCYDCHRDIHAVACLKTEQKKAVIENCTECHGNEEYAASGHGRAVMEGNNDAAACSDCHGLHATKVYHTSTEYYPDEAREFYSMACIHCHADAAMMERNELSADTVRFYKETYHGKVQDAGFPTKVAGCADCHTSHNILPKDDPGSTIHPDNLVANCGRCHSSFHPRFVRYKAHPDYHDRREYPVLFWTNVFMVGLLVSVFVFFWMHTLLWWRKSYWEKDRLERMGIDTECEYHIAGGRTVVRRFRRRDILMHVVLIISFFTLVLTGFPLKYHDYGWARYMMGIWGGAHMAGIFHRIAAIIMSAQFVYVLWRCYRFVLPKGIGREGWQARLFGTESLFPNRKDFEDIKDMFLWFFNRGEKPAFDRWSYWEKFDFLAVFWGMFVIGCSGIFLMAPEWTSYLFPGWVLNVAALMHSEEALLAALFIFTVHFFNTHLIPKKFPIDTTIFTGRYSLDEMAAERPAEYERLAAQDALADIGDEHPSIFTKIVMGFFGLASLLLGIFLAVLILLTVF